MEGWGQVWDRLSVGKPWDIWTPHSKAAEAAWAEPCSALFTLNVGCRCSPGFHFECLVRGL